MNCQSLNSKDNSFERPIFLVSLCVKTAKQQIMVAVHPQLYNFLINLTGIS